MFDWQVGVRLSACWLGVVVWGDYLLYYICWCVVVCWCCLVVGLGCVALVRLWL